MSAVDVGPLNTKAFVVHFPRPVELSRPADKVTTSPPLPHLRVVLTLRRESPHTVYRRTHIIAVTHLNLVYDCLF
jgi:hypothetical protein